MKEQKETLLSLLQHYSREGELPFHMPGHKRNIGLAPYLEKLGANLDVTEIPGFDDLHEPEGILADAMERTAIVCGSETSFFLINGSTGGILASIRAATSYGDRVLISRNCHKAVYNALELCGLRPIFLNPPEVPGFGCAASLPPEMVEHALATYRDIRLVILTSPTYEGVISDVEAICKLAHHRKIPVFVDEAHGAHLGLDEAFPNGAVSCGADLVVQSFHKTLPSLTQTGVLHVKSGLVSREEVARQLGIFQSSSPSYLLMASLEGCVSLLEKQKRKLFTGWKQRLLHFDEKIQPLARIQVLGYGTQKQVSIPGIYRLDPGKLVIGTENIALTGVQLMEILKEQFHIQLEMALEDYAVAMTGMGDSEEMMDRLAEALFKLEGMYPREKVVSHVPSCLELPRIQMSQAEAAAYPWSLSSAEKAKGCVCAEAIWAYPPGIPLIIAGEEVSEELIHRLLRMKEAGVHLCGTRGTPPEFLAVLELP